MSLLDELAQVRFGCTFNQLSPWGKEACRREAMTVTASPEARESIENILAENLKLKEAKARLEAEVADLQTEVRIKDGIISASEDWNAEYEDQIAELRNKLARAERELDV